jgi:hypothetical protein
VTCRRARSRLSAFLDGELPPRAAQAVDGHLRACAGCAERMASLRSAIESVADLPRLDCREPIAGRILNRLEVESRGPGLALLFRPLSAARPLLLPSLLPAAFLFALAVSGALALPPHGSSRVPGAEPSQGRTAPSGTEANPLFTSSGVSAPRVRGHDELSNRLLEDMAEGTLFVETVVARDGSVSTVTLLEGDSREAGPLLDAIRKTRFEPGRLRGRPVAVSVYRLISRMDVRAPLT